MARLRDLWLGLHRWLALSLGLLLALLGLSGSLLELKGPILRWEVGASMLQLAPGEHRAPLEQSAWINAAASAYPQLQKVFGAAPPRQGFLESDNVIVFGALKERPRHRHRHDRSLQRRAPGLLRLRRPVAGQAGGAAPQPAVAPGLGLELGAGVWRGAAGLAGQWPVPVVAGPAQLVESRQPAPGSRGTRRLREWHNVAAAWLCLPLLLIAGSGAWLARPDLFTWLAAQPMAIKPVLSAAHGHLLLGAPGAWLAFLCGISLPLLYITGLLLWWRKRVARRAVQSFKEPLHDTP